MEREGRDRHAEDRARAQPRRWRACARRTTRCARRSARTSSRACAACCEGHAEAAMVDELGPRRRVATGPRQLPGRRVYSRDGAFRRRAIPPASARSPERAFPGADHRGRHRSRRLWQLRRQQPQLRCEAHRRLRDETICDLASLAEVLIHRRAADARDQTRVDCTRRRAAALLPGCRNPAMASITVEDLLAAAPAFPPIARSIRPSGRGRLRGRDLRDPARLRAALAVDLQRSRLHPPLASCWDAA